MTKQEILNVLNDNYNLDIEDVSFLRKGGCMSYIVKSSYKKYLLKVISDAFMTTAIRSIGIQQYLIGQQFPVPKIMPGNNNQLYFWHNEQLFVLYEFIDGVEPSLDEDVGQIGQNVAKLHKVLKGYPDKLATHNKQFFVDRYIEILKKKHCETGKLNEYIEIGNGLWDSVKDLQYGFCHGDLYRGNLLKTAEGSIYFLDFDTSCLAPQLFDIAVICDTTDYFELSKKEFEHTTEIFHQFMKSYSDGNKELNFSIKQFYDFIVLRHFQLQATIVEIYGLDCIDEKFIDEQLEWIKDWRGMY